ncbi:MAG TPA: response regulator [Steroidobacteraceae bacterium]|jgi:two-component system response regulator BaeR|nr:response regulator [Steroidobacteraceae bacterium]
MTEPAAPRVLLIEDEPTLRTLLIDYLQAASFEIEALADGLEAVPRVRARAPDLVILDLMLPGCSGFDICRELRTFTDVPIIMTTARIEEVDRLLGLELGADDYLCKPFSPRELVARAWAILRRSAHGAPVAAPAGLLLDEERYLASYRGIRLELTPVEFRLLKTLASSPGRVFSRPQLRDRLYADRRKITDRTVDTHVKNLRRKLQAIHPGAELVHSIYGVGYKLEL